MSGALEELTAAVEAQTQAINKLIASAGGKAATGTKAAGTKAASTKKTTTSKAKLTVAKIAEAFGGYLKGAEDAEERAERTSHIRTIVAHFDAAKATEIDPDNFASAMEMLECYKRGETPPEFDEEEEEDEDGSLV